MLTMLLFTMSDALFAGLTVIALIGLAVFVFALARIQKPAARFAALARAEAEAAAAAPATAPTPEPEPASGVVVHA